MKLVSHYLEGIAGIEIYPIISFILFFTFFLMIIFWVIRADKSHMQKMAGYALEPEDLGEKAENHN